MKVVLVVEQLRRAVSGGIGTYARGLLQGLAAAGADRGVRLVLHASRARGGPDPLAAYGHPLELSKLPGPALTRAWDLGVLPGPAGDVVHATSLAFPPTRSPLSVLVHDLAWREVPEAYPVRGRRWHEAALARAVGKARVLVVPSQRVADHLVAAGAKAHTVEVIEEGGDHLPPADLAATDALLDSLGVREGFLLTVSTVEPRKNLSRLLAAYDSVRSELAEPWPLVVVGPTGWGDALPSSSIPHGVVLAGHVDDAVLAGLYRRCRCLAYVPLVEGFGLPPVEAMRECAPVVSSPIPSTAGASLEVDPTDVAAIGRALVAASSNERVRSELVTAGLLRAADLTWETAAKRHLEVWRSLR
ncbi:MAG TPA: glycosyltransferase family 1 protein [Acidimicrobiales bacterium]|jgi:glycosyltransferase involved in cell wall biosynthesis|nr:glycosyltransferase family 1 protein [Acidimicrobiales bacterium]